MIGCCSDALDSASFLKLGGQGRFKLVPSVCGKLSWNSKACHPVGKEGLRTILASWHKTQVVTHVAVSFFMLGQEYFLVICFLAFFRPGCAKLCVSSNM